MAKIYYLGDTQAKRKDTGEVVKLTGQGSFDSDIFDVVSGDTSLSQPSELGIMTTDIGAGYLKKDQSTLDKLSGVNTNLQMTPEEMAGGATGVKNYQARVSKLQTPEVKAPETTTPGKIKFLNLNDQSVELSGGSITPEAYQNLLDQGYFAIEKSGDVPSWASVGDIQSGRESAKLSEYKKEVDDLTSGMKNYMVSDAALNSQISQITNLYDTRIKDMEDINKRRIGAVKTLGIRLGSRYTGGEGGVMGGIITAEERAGVQRINDLEAEKQSAIQKAKDAQLTQNWSIYSKQVETAEARYKEQRDLVSELNKKIVEENKKVQEQKVRSSRDSAIADLISQGVSDPTEILNYLNYYEDGTPTGGDFTMEEVFKVFDNIQKATKSENLQGDVGEWTDAIRSGAVPANTTLMDYLRQKKQATATPEKPLDILDVGRYNELYPGAGVTAGDTKTTADAKVAALSQPRDYYDEDLRKIARANKTANTSYEEAIAGIDADITIKNKDRAKLIMSEIYGKTGEQKPGFFSGIFSGKKQETKLKPAGTIKVGTSTEKYFGELNSQILDFNKNYLGQ